MNELATNMVVTLPGNFRIFILFSGSNQNEMKKKVLHHIRPLAPKENQGFISPSSYNNLQAYSLQQSKPTQYEV